MSDAPWSRFPDPDQHPRLRRAYRHLQPEQRARADAAIASAQAAMNALLTHPGMAPLPWPGLDEEDARRLDLAERTHLAAGRFRLGIAAALGTGRTALSDGLDDAADALDARAAGLALRALTRCAPSLATLRAGEPAAYQQLLGRLVDLDADLWTVAEAQSELSQRLDVALERAAQRDALDELLPLQQRVRTAARALGAPDAPPARRAELAALWSLGLRGLGRLFGEDDQTATYAD